MNGRPVMTQYRRHADTLRLSHLDLRQFPFDEIELDAVLSFGWTEDDLTVQAGTLEVAAKLAEAVRSKTSGRQLLLPPPSNWVSRIVPCLGTMGSTRSTSFSGLTRRSLRKSTSSCSAMRAARSLIRCWCLLSSCAASPGAPHPSPNPPCRHSRAQEQSISSHPLSGGL